MLKSLTLALIAAALLCALPAAAASNPAQPAAPSACPQPLFNFAAPQPNSTPALPAWLTDPSPATTPTTTPYRGYCACECSSIRDCNTDADCSNHHCLKAISCC